MDLLQPCTLDFLFLLDRQNFLSQWSHSSTAVTFLFHMISSAVTTTWTPPVWNVLERVGSMKIFWRQFDRFYFISKRMTNTRMTHERDLFNDNSKNRQRFGEGKGWQLARCWWRTTCGSQKKEECVPGDYARIQVTGCTTFLLTNGILRLVFFSFSSWNSSIDVRNRGRVWYPVIPPFLRIKWTGYTVFQRKNRSVLAKTHLVKVSRMKLAVSLTARAKCRTRWGILLRSTSTKIPLSCRRRWVRSESIIQVEGALN